MPDAVALIPARGGSKRLPRKNVLDFLGRPVLGYTIDAAKQSNLFARVVVSTEDEEIAAIATRYGAEVAWRPTALAGDDATVSQVCGRWLESESEEGHHYDILCCLYATAPMRRAADIVATVSLLERGRCHYAIAATDFAHYPHQALKLMPDGFVAPMWPALATLRSEAVGRLIAGNGSTYAVYADEFLRTRTFYGPGMRAHLMPLDRSVDIDTEDDFRIAVCLARCAREGIG